MKKVFLSILSIIICVIVILSIFPKAYLIDDTVELNDEKFIFTDLPYFSDKYKKPIGLCGISSDNIVFNNWRIIYNVDNDYGQFCQIQNFSGKNYALLFSENINLSIPTAEDVSYIVNNTGVKVEQRDCIDKLFLDLNSTNHNKISVVGAEIVYLKMFLNKHKNIYYQLEILYFNNSGKYFVSSFIDSSEYVELDKTLIKQILQSVTKQ